MRSYLEVWRLPRVAPAVGASIVGRLHESMLSFAVILLVSPANGYASSGLVLAALGVGQTVGAPFWGRRADRSDQARVLVGTAAAQAAALVALSVVGSSVPRGVALAAVAGLVTPPLTPAVRAVLPRLVPAGRAATAYALESTFQELIFVGGPLLAGAVAATLGAGAAFRASALLTLAGTVGYVWAVRPVVGRPASGDGVADEGSGDGDRTGVLRVLAGGTVFLVVLCVESVALVDRVSGATAAPVASWYLSATSVGSVVGGLVVGARLRAADGPRRRFAWMVAGVAALLVGAALPDPWGAGALAVAALGFGATIAPVATTLFQRLSRAAPAARATEAFGWMGAAMGVGGVVGDAAGGWLVEHAGAVAALAVALVVAGTGVWVAPGDDAAGRRRHARRPGSRPRRSSVATSTPSGAT